MLPFAEATPVTDRIGENIAEFLFTAFSLKP